MATDTRSLRFESKNDAQRWRVLQAVEDTALHAATQHNLDTQVVAHVQHGGGQYLRANIVEAKSAAERSGFVANDISLDIDRLEPEADGYVYNKSWVKAHLMSGTNRVIEVSVEGDNEVEVNGVFAMIESAVRQALQTPAPASGVSAAAPASWWGRALNHPYSVQILGGAGATALVAAAVAAWTLWR